MRLLFFFQAEDGIRDLTVTGVQTCALPILPRAPGAREPDARLPALRRARAARGDARLLSRLRADAGRDHQGRELARGGDPPPRAHREPRGPARSPDAGPVGAARGRASVQLGVDAARAVARARLPARRRLQATDR